MFHDSLCLSNLLVKRIDLKLCVSQNLKKMLCLIIYRVYKMFDWFAGDGFRCSSALCLSFTFLNFCFFSELSPFFIFHYFLYFETTSQPIMEINTPNWSLGLVEYIKYKGISSHSYDVMIWRHKFQISKLSPILKFKHFECLLDYWCYMYNVSCC